jgi:epoxide hydrolase 4
MNFLFGILNVTLFLFALIFYVARNRTQKLFRQYDTFRTEFETNHTSINLGFNHYQLLVEGTHWHYVDEGPRDGPVVLFIHGFPECWYVWRYILPAIDPRYRLIAIDLKGFGRSTTTNTDYNWHSVGKQIHALMKQLDIDRYFVVSHDWGTLIGSVLVHDHQSHILGYIRMQVELNVNHDYDYLGDFGQFIIRPQFFFFQFPWLMELIMADRKTFLMNVYQGRMTTNFQEEDQLYLTYEYSRSNLVKDTMRYMHYTNWDFTTAMDKICYHSFNFPVLQLQADQDHTQPNKLFENVNRDCKNIQLEWIKGAGHFDMFDDPDAISLALNGFLNRYYPGKRYLDEEIL